MKQKNDGAEKIKLLNFLLAGNSVLAAPIYSDAAKGIEKAVADASGTNESLDVSNFAKNILSLYDPYAEVELLEFGDGHFDPLFAIPTISSAIKRLSGFKRAILVVYGLDKTLRGESGRISPKRKAQYWCDIDFIEDYALRYKDAFPNLEILFI